MEIGLLDADRIQGNSLLDSPYLQCSNTVVVRRLPGEQGDTSSMAEKEVILAPYSKLVAGMSDESGKDISPDPEEKRTSEHKRGRRRNWRIVLWSLLFVATAVSAAWFVEKN